MKGLCRVADVIVPNLTEACFLTDTPYRPDAEFQSVLEKLNGLCPHASITGCEEGASSTVYYTDETARCAAIPPKKCRDSSTARATCTRAPSWARSPTD